MTVTKRGIPTYEQPMTVGKNMSASWRRWFHDTEVGTPPSNEVVIKPVGASPFSYQAPSRGAVIISGGTVSSVTYSRTTGTNHATGQTSGMFPVSLGDVLIVTYASVPTMVFTPS
jgi:hypothetical protein